MNLKYQTQLKSCSDQPCPCTQKFKPKKLIAFRFLKKNPTESDFVPPAILEGPRTKERCSRFALSFFSSLDSARAKFAMLAERIDAASKFGDQVGEIEIFETDGLVCEPATTGHLDLHEYESTSFLNRIAKFHPVARATKLEGRSDVT